jgi:hypothetical protein
MKTPLTFLTLLLCLLASCAPTPNEPDRPENKLQHAPQSQILTPAQPSRVVKSTLVCGCGFILMLDSMGGDTNVITYSIPSVATGATQQSHDVTVTANTTGLASGMYTSWVALHMDDQLKGPLRDTIYDTLNVP